MSTQTSSRTLAVPAEPAEPVPQRKKEEFRTWLFLSLVMAPVLAVLVVSTYGFVVWFYQLIAGPPSM
jgi:periplasmic nitrate reductase NapE